MSEAHQEAGQQAALDLSGKRLGDFRVLRKLGQGGMGQVYLAEQISLKRKVALKILRPDLAASPTAMIRFRQEAEAVAKITHANIVQVYAFGMEGGMPYMALEYVEGRNLREFLAKKGPPDLMVSLSIMRQVASALQRASEAGIIHRDIKPENILLTRKGEVKVADFGLSRCLEENEKPAVNLTQTGVTMGTPMYMSPEQVEGKEVDPRSDIYSLGVTSYHMLAGEPPFRGTTAFEVALQHVQKEPEPLGKVRPDLPEPVCSVVHKMMAKDPAKRYQTGRDLLRDLTRVRDGLSGATTNFQGLVTEAGHQSGLTSGASVASATVGASTTPPRTGGWSGMGWVAAVAATVLAAAAGGAAYAWRERASEGPLPLGAEIQAGDASASEIDGRPSVRERKLRESVELYLNPTPGRHVNLAGGTGVCMDLGLFYLEEGRLEEAEKLFQRMERVSTPPTYHVLGQFGLAVTLALQNKGKASNDLFRELAPRVKSGSGGGFGGKFGKDKGMWPLDKSKDKGRFDPGLSKLQPILQLLGDARWRFYYAQAKWRNRANGAGDIPKPFAEALGEKK
jgi:serine/threonine-protein kinase